MSDDQRVSPAASAPSGRNGDRPDRRGPQRFIVRNEFAVVAIELRGEPGHECLRIEDTRSEVSVELDALELESLAWASHRDLAPLLDPSRTRWQREGGA